MNTTQVAYPRLFAPFRPAIFDETFGTPPVSDRTRQLAVSHGAAIRVALRFAGVWCGALRWLGRTALVAVLVLATVTLGTHAGRVALMMALVVPEMLPDSPVHPLRWVTTPPGHEEDGYETPAGRVDYDLYVPRSAGKHGAIILYTGAFGLRSDPSFVQAAEALARSGAVVMVPESEALRSGEIRPADALALRESLAILRARPEVDPERIGILGFSAGGSLVLLAAEDEVVRDQVAFLNIFGAYYDAEELLIAVAANEIDAGAGTQPWQASDVARYTFMKQVVLALPDANDRDILGRAYLDRDPDAQGDLYQLSADGRLVRELFARPTRERAAEIVAALPQSSRDHLASISPRHHVGDIKANLYLMHGRKDRHIPVDHARKLAADVPPGVLRQYSEFDLFIHVTPDPDLDRVTMARELVKLGRHAWLVGQEYL